MALKLLISDFDGTLVDTFEANFLAYEMAFAEQGFKLERDVYKSCFGYRFDDLLKATKAIETLNKSSIAKVRERKKQLYPEFFEYLVQNKGLIELIRSFKDSGGKTAVASTATRENLINALSHFHVQNIFDLILSGEAVKHGKPSPEIYLKVLEYFNIVPQDALVFEDTEIGLQAAKIAGIPVIRINTFG